MSHTTRRADDTDDEDFEKGVLKDRHSYRVRMTMMDGKTGRKMRADPDNGDEDEDENPEEEREAAAEGENAMADSARDSGVRIVDAYGSGDPLAMRRPGPRYVGAVRRASDAEYLHEVRIERRTAMRDHESFLNNSWRGNQQRDDWGQMKVGDPCTCKSSDDEGEFGSDGTLQMRAGKGLVCVATRRDARSTRDAIEQARRDYVRDLTTAWQHPTTRDADFRTDVPRVMQLSNLLEERGYDRNAIAAFVSRCAQSGDLDTSSIEDLARRFEAQLGTSYGGKGNGGTGDSQPTLAELVRRHQDTMNRIYDARDRELGTWRVGK
jgi:hypothetical protein